MALGTIILTDFDTTRKTIKPAIMANMAVRVPDWNIPQVTAAAVIKKKILSLFSFDVIPNTKNATAEAPALQP